MQRMHASLNLIEINHLKNLLEAGGVRCLLRNELMTVLAGEVPFDQCAAQLWIVDDADRWRADEIVAEWRAARFRRGPPWVCGACGEPHEGQFAACWKCGMQRPAAQAQ